ncbi:MAG: hypothetical protein ACTSXD_13395 [Candidatus Heimdallarchaeaceae archaeon]
MKKKNVKAYSHFDIDKLAEEIDEAIYMNNLEDEYKKISMYYQYWVDRFDLVRKKIQDKIEKFDRRISFDDEKVEKIKKKAEKIEQYTLLKFWLELFNRESVCNEIPNQILLHVLLGQLLKEKRIKIGIDSYLDWRIHLFWIQNSRSGKGEAVNLLEYIANDIRFYGLDENGKLVKKSPLTIKELTPSMTSASLINSVRRNKKGEIIKDEFGEMEIKHGELADADIVVYKEAKVLITPRQYYEELQDIFIKLLEPIGKNTYKKKLQDYDYTIETTADISLIATTTMIEDIRRMVIERGLAQRCIFYPREIDTQLRKTMATEIQKRKKDLSDLEDREKLKEIIVKELDKVYIFALKNDIKFSPKEIEKIRRYKIKRLNDFYDSIERKLFAFKSVLESFVASFDPLVDIISHHSAAMRFSKNVELIDIEYAFILLERVFDAIKLWIEIFLKEETWYESEEKKQMVRFIEGALLKNDGEMALSELKKIFAKRFLKSLEASAYHIKKLAMTEVGYKIYKKDNRLWASLVS